VEKGKGDHGEKQEVREEIKGRGSKMLGRDWEGIVRRSFGN